MSGKEIKVKKLTLENFRRYGSFINLIEVSPEDFFRIGKPPIEFFPDLTTLNVNREIVGISLCRVHPREFKINLVEHHNYIEEGIPGSLKLILLSIIIILKKVYYLWMGMS